MRDAELRALIARGPFAHLVTVNPDGFNHRCRRSGSAWTATTSSAAARTTRSSFAKSGVTPRVAISLQARPEHSL
jgi:hypothetical protein